MIKHIVINGGGPTAFISYGALRQLCMENFVDMDKINSIYATSSGAIVAALLSLKYEWNVLDDYIIKRPWEDVFQLQPEDFLNIFHTKGLFQFHLSREIFKHLLEAKDLSVDVTMKEFHEYNGIDLHFISLEINKFEKVDVSYKTFPDLTLLKAIEMSSAFPILFKPVFLPDNDEKCYVDGGIVDNYPLSTCIENEKCDVGEVLGIRNVGGMFEDMNVSPDNNLLEFLQGSMYKIIMHLHIQHSKEISLDNEIKCDCDRSLSNYTEWLDYLTNRDKRQSLILLGSAYAATFLEERCSEIPSGLEDQA